MLVAGSLGNKVCQKQCLYTGHGGGLKCSFGITLPSSNLPAGSSQRNSLTAKCLLHSKMEITTAPPSYPLVINEALSKSKVASAELASASLSIPLEMSLV